MTTSKPTPAKYHEIYFTWEVKAHGQTVIFQELTLDVDADYDGGNVYFTVEGIGANGFWLEKDTPLFAMIAKAAMDNSHVRDAVNALFEWETCGETGFGNATGWAA